MICLHNSSVQFANPSPGTFDFDQNALFFAEAGDTVVTRKKIPDSYLAFLTECGLSFEGINFIFSQDDLAQSRESIFFDQAIFGQVESLVKQRKNVALDSFVLTEYEAGWAKRAGVHFEGTPEQSLFGSKSVFRALAKKYRFPIACGYEHQKTALDIAIRMGILFLCGFREVVVKQDEGVAALGSRRFTRQEFLSKFFSLEYFLSDQKTHGVLQGHSSGFVVEGWYDDVLYSPSIQLYVTPTGAVELVSTHIQLFYENKMRYKGCLSSHFLESHVQERLVSEGKALALVFAERGYRGHLAFDAIILPGERLVWEELNPRRVMSSYPFQIRKKIFGEGAEGIPYISKHIQRPRWRGKTIEDMLEIFAPVLFSCKKNDGVVPFDYGLLSEQGRLSLVVFGKGKERVAELHQYVETL